MSSFDFKSSGRKVDSRLESSETWSKTAPDVGIKTPLSNGQGRQIFDMHDDPRAQIKDNMRNLLLTNRGERLGLFDYGADLSSLLFEMTSVQSIEKEIVKRITKAVEVYMPGVQLDEVSTSELDRNEKNEINKKGMVKIKLKVVFSIPAARINNQAVEVTLQNGG